MLKVEDLHVSYGAVQALKGVSFHVEDGEICALIGANGAGKTTTLHAITGKGESLIGQWVQLTDYLVARIKQKKFKDIQLKFSSDSRFSLESATLECFVGGYIKR